MNLTTILNLVALGALGAFVFKVVPLKTALYVGVGAIVLVQIIPAATSTSGVPSTTA
jgi:hypothetical protein